MKRLKHSEYLVHTVALSIAILGPLLNLIFGFISNLGLTGYLYWATCLLLYIIILTPFTYKTPLTLVRLIILGITVEDFSSHVWRSIFEGRKLIPFCNWYTQHFPFLGRLGEATPLILIPKWYIVALFLYFLITIIQFRKHVFRKLTHTRKNELR